MARIKPQALLLQSKRKKGPARVALPTLIATSAVVALLFLSGLFLHRYKAKREHDSQFQSFELQENDNFLFGGGQKFAKAPRFAVLNTTKGAISVLLSVQGALKAVQHFVKYSRSGYYDGLPFHRVMKHYMIQGGDPESAGTMEEWTQGGHLNDALEASMKHEPFMLATTKVYQESSGFELYITTTAIPHLDDKLLVFGRVVRGEDIVQEIEEVDTDEHYRPKASVLINNISFHDEL